MLLILAPSKGFSMAANPMVSFTLTPDHFLSHHYNVSAS